MASLFRAGGGIDDRHLGGPLRVSDRAWPLLHILALGDAENDESLFALCGACVAVADADEFMRDGADRAVPDCAADGAGRMLDQVRRGGGACPQPCG